MIHQYHEALLGCPEIIIIIKSSKTSRPINADHLEFFSS